MSIIGDIISTLTLTKQPRVPYIIHLPMGGLGATGKTNEYLRAYGQIGWVFACVSRIGSSVGETEWLVETGKGKRAKKTDEHPLLDLLADANPWWTGQELFEYSQMHLDLSGEAFWVLNMGRGGAVQEIWPVPPDRMRIMASKTEYITGYQYEYQNEKVPLKPEEVIHFKLPNPFDMYRGLGPIQAAANDLDSELYASRWNRNFFENSARPDGVLETDQSLTDAQAQGMAQEWAMAHKGIDRAHRVAILEAGVKYKQVSVSQQDMAFVEQRRMNRDIILGIYGMPLSILGITENVNRANAESGEYVFARWVLRPRLQRLARKLDETLVPMFGKGLSLTYEDPTPENRDAARADAQSGITAGYMMMNEARELMDLEPVKTGDVFMLGAMVVPTPIDDLIPDEDEAAPPTSSEPPAILPPPPEAAPEPSDTPVPSPPAVEPTRGWRDLIAMLNRGEEPPGYQVGRKGKALAEEAKERLGNQFVKRAIARERPWQRMMHKYWREQKADVIAALGGKSLKQLEDFDWEAAITELTRIGKPRVIDTLVKAAVEAVEDYSLGTAFDVDNPRVQKWIGERLQQFSEAVNQTSKDEIQAILREAEANGESIAQMTERIRAYYDGIGYRAERVARTEVVGASNAGAAEAYRQNGVSRKEWLTTIDGRQRDTHEEVNGQVVGIDDFFTVGGSQMSAPGDGDDPAEIINCRCTILPVIE